MRRLVVISKFAERIGMKFDVFHFDLNSFSKFNRTRTHNDMEMTDQDLKIELAHNVVKIVSIKHFFEDE